MATFTDVFSLEDSAIPEPDELSEAIYKSTRLGYLFSANEDGEPSNVEGHQEEIQTQNRVDIRPPSEAKPEPETNAESEPQASNWRLLRVLANAHSGWVRSVTVDPVTNDWFVTGSSDSTIKIWDLASSALKATITGHVMGVRALAVSKKFPYLFSGSEDRTVRCWDLEKTNSSSGSQIRDYHGHVGGVYAVSLHPELDLLVTGGKDQVVRVWDIRTRAQAMVLTGHRNDITSIATASVDPQVITSSMDGTIRLWDLRNQRSYLTLTQHSKSIRSMQMHPTEMTACSADSSGNFKQWLLPGGDLLNEFGESGQDKIVNTLAIEPNSNTLFAGYDNGAMEFYDYVSGSLVQTTHTTPAPGSSNSSIYASTFDMSGLRLLTCEGDKCIKVWGEE
ncbi:Pre-mRNA-splicing factor PRP46 [Meyerozyma sp. JA9]|nr:Pre-mRNA-splicing factor PRP46 [Meyerozyma sp. JA9]